MSKFSRAIPASAAFVATAAILLSLNLASCGRRDREADKKPAAKIISVGIVEVKTTAFSEYGTYYGRLSGAEEASLIAVLGGRVEAVQAREGDRVKQGQSLASINAAKADSIYELAVLNEKIARTTLENQRQFLADGNASKLSVDQSEMAWLTSKDALIDAKRALDGAHAITPIDGVVVRRFIEPHQELMSGAPTFAVSRMDRVRVKIGIPEQEIDGIQEGNPAEVSLSAQSGRVWQGRLSRLGRAVDPASLTFDAEVLVDNSDGVLLSGTTVAVRLLRRSLTNQVVVPNEALLTDGKETYVMVEDNLVAKRFPVLIGPSNRTQTVIAKGLQSGLHLIIQGNHLVTEGAQVAVTESR